MAATTFAAVEIKLIHIGKMALQMDDETYRAMLAGKCNGKTSSKQLTASERQRVLMHMKACGFVIQRRDGRTAGTWHREPQLGKLRAIWYSLADAGAVARPADAEACDRAIESWAKRQMPKLDALRFASGYQMSQLIEEGKAWQLRVGAATE